MGGDQTAASMITHDRLLQLLSYDPETGEFRWKVDRRAGSHAQFIVARSGEIAGSPTHGEGYVQICIDGRNYVAHRIAWFYVHQEWPKQIDHVNGIRTDNRLANLRPATQVQQNANSRLRVTNKSGFKGVSFDERRGRWRATIVKNGKQRWLGYYDAPQAAHAAYVTAAKEMFGEFARPE